IREEQQRIRQQIIEWQIYLKNIATSPFPTFGDVGVLTFSKGQEQPITQKIHWNQYKLDDILVKVAVYDLNNKLVTDAVVVPPELRLNFEQNDVKFEYKVKALNREGTFKVRLTPAVGPPKEFQVIVK